MTALIYLLRMSVQGLGGQWWFHPAAQIHPYDKVLSQPVFNNQVKKYPHHLILYAPLRRGEEGTLKINVEHRMMIFSKVEICERRSMVHMAPTRLGLCVFLMHPPAPCSLPNAETEAVSAGFRHFHKWKYKWWSIRDDFLDHFLKSLTNSVTSSWITSGTFYNAKSSRHNHRILFNGAETLGWRSFLTGGGVVSSNGGVPSAQKWGPYPGRGPSWIPTLSYSNMGLSRGDSDLHPRDVRKEDKSGVYGVPIPCLPLWKFLYIYVWRCTWWANRGALGDVPGCGLKETPLAPSQDPFHDSCPTPKRNQPLPWVRGCDTTIILKLLFLLQMGNEAQGS